LPGKKKNSARRVSHAQSFTLLLFFFTCIILSKTKKQISSFIVVTSICLLFSLARMSNPEVEICTFKQQGGESLKDA
jgi:hypothetical protein